MKLMMPSKSSLFFSFKVFFSCIWVVAFPAPQLKIPPASHTKGAAEICAMPKGRTKNPQIPSGPLIFNFSKILFTVHPQGLQFQPLPRWDLWEGIHIREGKWGGGEEEIKPKKSPKPHIQNPARGRVNLGELLGCDEHQLCLKKDQNSTQQELLQHRTDTPNSLFPKQRHVWKTVPRQIKQHVSTAKRFVQDSKSCLKRERKLK